MLEKLPMEHTPRFVYSAIPAHCIRVLNLHPSPYDAPLSCDIEVQELTGKPYDALSYVWGDPTPTDSIECLDDSCKGIVGITANLAKALIAFRLVDRIRRIWVDALCINQEDLTERQSQVRLMGKVFNNAQCVLCWLGNFNDLKTEECRARLAIDFLRNFNTKPLEYLHTAQQHLLFENGTTESKSTVLASWLAIKQLFDLEYFHRVWVIQEVGLARHARMFWGNSEVWLDWVEVEAFASFMDAKGASIVNHLQLKSWMANHVTLVWKTTAGGQPVFSFVEVLHWARVHRSSDPRDFIYGLLSHPSSTVKGSLLIEPNYRISTSGVYTNLALNVIKRTDSLQILAFVDHGEDSNRTVLPTWVPDWQAINLVAPLRTSTQAAEETSESISFAQFGARTVLKCNGVLVGTVCALSNMINPSELTVTCLEKEMQKKNPFLIQHFWNKVMSKPGMPTASTEQFLKSLSFVLTGCHRDDVPVTESNILEQQLADLAAYILEFERILPSDDPGGFLANLSAGDRSWLESIARQGSATQFIQDMTWTSMCRKVFRTSDGHIGLGHRTMKEDDVCVVLQGSVYPLVLRRCDHYFELVGPALLYGFMDGEADRLRLDGKLFHQEFNII